jgi:hypothetical protein
MNDLDFTKIIFTLNNFFNTIVIDYLNKSKKGEQLRVKSGFSSGMNSLISFTLESPNKSCIIEVYMGTKTFDISVFDYRDGTELYEHHDYIQTIDILIEDINRAIQKFIE